MNRQEAKTLALEIMAEHGLVERGVGFKWSRAKRWFGEYAWRRDRATGDLVEEWIALSGPLTDINDRATVEDTIRHEVAHALAGTAAGHGPEWKRQCAVTGAKPSRTCSDAEPVPHRWHGVCGWCGEVAMRRHRLTRATRDNLYMHSRCAGRPRPEGRDGSRPWIHWVDMADQVIAA